MKNGKKEKNGKWYKNRELKKNQEKRESQRWTTTKTSQKKKGVEVSIFTKNIETTKGGGVGCNSYSEIIGKMTLLFPQISTNYDIGLPGRFSTFNLQIN